MANGRYQLTLDNGEQLQLYEEVILKYELLLKKEIKKDKMISIEEYNTEWDVYYTALKSLKSRFKSSYELRKSLSSKLPSVGSCKPQMSRISVVFPAPFLPIKP